MTYRRALDALYAMSLVYGEPGYTPGHPERGTETRDASADAGTATVDPNAPEPPRETRQQRRARERAETKAGLRQLKIGRRVIRAVNR